MHVRLWPRVSWESTPGHGGPHAGGCRSGGTGPEASHDVTAASSELAMITSSRGSPKRLGISEKCLEPQLLRTTTECCCLCGCMVLVLLVLAMLQLYSFIVVLLCRIPRNYPPICRESCEKNCSYISNGWASRPVASDGVDRVSVAAGLAPPPRTNIIKVDPCERGPCAHGCPNNKHLVVGLS